ncbi:MAG: prepilin-type N-terminal cleavage/methylation domain-containing protein [Candidatus Eiseniibacteriota bacterium]
MRPNTNIRGFSLVEIMVVVVIVGIILTIGIPSTARYIRVAQLAGARNTLMEDLGYARTLAVMRRKTYEIRFNSSTYTLVQLSPAATIWTHTLPVGYSCSATDTATYYAWGLTAPISVTVKCTGSSDSTTVQLLANGSLSHN